MPPLLLELLAEMNAISNKALTEAEECLAISEEILNSIGGTE